MGNADIEFVGVLHVGLCHYRAKVRAFFFQVDPHYFERTFLLIPNNSEKPYALLRKVLEQTGLTAIGR